MGVATEGVAHAKEQQQPTESEGDRRKQNVKADVGGKLGAGEHQGIEFEHGSSLRIIESGKALQQPCHKVISLLFITIRQR